ncbi:MULTISPECIES: WXG100 family type VII secretion target [Streptomyces]|uniref:WXG100 family type VII secretion target n=1 Tax=Streptomyces TaxID=1883 RepID=UPI000CD4ABB1|nr:MULTISPECIES: WXG100 family type VII secretion target [Streptomyces]
MSDFGEGSIYMNYGGVNNASDDLINQTRAIRTLLSTLEQELAALKSSWVGEDKDSYTEKQAAWDRAVTNMEEMLKNNSLLLDNLSDNYRHGERSLGQMWQGVKIGR